MNTSDAKTVPGVWALEFRHVSLSFDDKRALSDVSFELQRRQMICVTGMASSGKSVLLHLAIGLLRPDYGQILIAGRRIDRLTENELLAIRGDSIGLAFQEDTLFTSMSVYENAAYRLVEHGWSEADTDRAVIEILHFVGLENDAEKLPDELSIGMRRRLEIARALVGWPQIMLFDEPVSGLDPVNARRIMDLIIRARDLHEVASLYVTKELHEISYLATHYGIEDDAGRVSIRKGRREQVPETKVLLLDEGEVAFFGGVAEYKASETPAVTRMTQYQMPVQKAGGITSPSITGCQGIKLTPSFLVRDARGDRPSTPPAPQARDQREPLRMPLGLPRRQAYWRGALCRLCPRARARRGL